MTFWNVCIATLNRADALDRAIRHLLQQTIPPVQIVIIDASEDWQDTHASISALLVDRPAIRLDYIHSEIRSSATQRNIGIKASIGDVIFIIDDDSFLYPDCAEAMLALYDADPDGNLAAARMALTETLPPLDSEGDAVSLQRKTSGNRVGLARHRKLLLGNRLGRWFHRRVLMQSIEEAMTDRGNILCWSL